jgi:uncharacterized protein (TIGR03790 family)
MKAFWRLTLILLVIGPPASAAAGGSGLNVLVVVNQNSTNSVQLGNYYCEQRRVPPQNVFRINWPGGDVEWANADFRSYLLNPVLGAIASRQLSNQIDYVVLSMDIPYRVYQGGYPLSSGTNSTTAALFYGFKTDYALANYDPASCNLPAPSSNSYAGSECVFRTHLPDTASTNAFLAMMITSSNLALAKAIIDRGVASDSSFSSQTVVLGKSADPFRNIRYREYNNTIFDTRLRGNYSVIRTNLDSPVGFSNLLGYANGAYQFPVSPNTFIPGAMADSLTSFGGILFVPNDHTTLLALLNAGASGSYGTIIEPCGYLEKFPSSQTYFYQARGFSLAECYYQSLTNPYQGLLVGEPLAAPFGYPPGGAWLKLPALPLLTGTTNLSVQFDAVAPDRPAQQVDLFVDGAFAGSLTNIAPWAGNVLTVTIRGHIMSYAVPAGATIGTIASGLTTLLNDSANTNLTQVFALGHGDRIELRSFDAALPGTQVPVSVSASLGSATALTTGITASGPTLLDSVAYGIRGFSIGNDPRVGDYLQFTITKTNGGPVKLSLTNTISGNTIASFVQGLVNLVNTDASLQGSDGLIAEDFISIDPDTGAPVPQFNLRARSAGWSAAGIQAGLSGSPTFAIVPVGAKALDLNLSDLQPRGHLYITAGVTNLPLTFALNTTNQANGFHELTAVVYEGSHVRTQERVIQEVQVKNGNLAASFITLVGGTNTALEATLQFAVNANTNNIGRIELFSTGGSLGFVADQSYATFSVAAAYLGIGLHPFYAVVTAADGRQYRSETRWMRIIGREAPFRVRITAPPPTLTWPAVAGRSYEILSRSSLGSSFQLYSTLTPSNSAAWWQDTNNPGPQRFYRVRTAN